MANTIQIKRGNGTSALLDGELGYNPNLNTLYIGTSNGNKVVGGEGYFLPLVGGNLTGSLTIQNKSVYHEGNIVYSTTQPTKPIKGMIWLEP